jgi:SAM-dependent methyltransferase
MNRNLNFEQFVEDHLNLQVKISYRDHHDFLLRHELKSCSLVLDIGTGNGTFVSRLAQDHPEIQFVGIDKRRLSMENAHNMKIENLQFQHVDMFSRSSSFDFSIFDGFIMRYFLLHVDNSKKILKLLKDKSKIPSRFWIIDLDWSQFHCVPRSEVFDKLTTLVKDFCSKISVDSLAGQNVVPLLEQLNFQNIVVENLPFSSSTMAMDDLALYLKQEVQCYSRMSGRALDDPETEEIVRFIEEDFRSGKFEISYGMVLISSDLASN